MDVPRDLAIAGQPFLPACADDYRPDGAGELAPDAHEQPPPLTAGLRANNLSRPSAKPTPPGQMKLAGSGRHLRLPVGWIDLYES